MNAYAEMMRARKRPRHERQDFAAAMRKAGLNKCECCGDWSSDVGPVRGKNLCGTCSAFPVRAPNPERFTEGTLEHMMASHMAAKETA